MVLYRTSGAGSRLRKYTIGPYGRVTLHVARNEAQRVLVARTEGRDPASEKREARLRLVADRVDDLVDAFIKQGRQTVPGDNDEREAANQDGCFREKPVSRLAVADALLPA